MKSVIRNPKSEAVRVLTAVSLAILAAQLNAATLVTQFATDPLAAGWQAHGNTSLFTWDSTNQNLRVTWDSSQPNSYFALPLGATFSRSNDFLITFDLNLADIAVGTTPGKPLTFEIAVGLVNLQQATNAGFVRGSGYQSPNLVEWDYFPNDINNYGASISTPIVSTAHAWASGGFTFPLELATNVLYGVQMIYTAADSTLRSTMTSNGVPIGPLQDTTLGAGFDDFAVNALAISSYNDAGQFPGYEGSVLAHGTIDNVAFASPLPVASVALVSASEVSFTSDTNWIYTLESSADFSGWADAAPSTPGNGATLVLQATKVPADKAFYRVRAELP